MTTPSGSPVDEGGPTTPTGASGPSAAGEKRSGEKPAGVRTRDSKNSARRSKTKNSRNSKNSQKFSTQLSDTFKGKRRRKRDRIPKDFDEWTEEDKALFTKANIHMKLYKQAMKQCYPTIDDMSFFDRLKRKWQHAVSQRQAEDHKQSMQLVAKYKDVSDLDVFPTLLHGDTTATAPTGINPANASNT